MIWFHRLFPVLMLAWPAVFTLCSRPHPALALPEAGARTRRLVLVSLLALVVHGVVRLWIETSSSLPIAFGVGWTPFVSSFGSLALWFWVGMPALAARQPGWGPMPAPASEHAALSRGPSREPLVRSASLVPRERSNPVPRGAWLAGWAACAACAAATLWAIARGVSPALLTGLCFWLGCGPLATRSSLLEPEPLDEHGSPELLLAYARLRRFKAWGFFWFGLCGTFVFAAIAVASAVYPREAGLAGGLSGAALGLLGGAFGTLASVRRARINTLRHELGARAS